MTGDCGSKFQNKNLWGGINYTRTAQGVVFELKEDGTMTINGTATSSTAYSYDGGRVASNNIYITLPAGTYNYRIDNPNNDLQYQLYELPKDSTTLTMLSSSTSKTITIEEAKQIGVRINVPVGVTLNNYTAKIIIEKGSTSSDYIAHAEQNAPLSLGNTELYEGDEIEIDYVQKAGYKKVTGARLVSIMGYYTFTGEENFTKSTSIANTTFYTAIFSQVIKKAENNNAAVKTYSNCFIRNYSANRIFGNDVQGIAVGANGHVHFGLGANSEITTVGTFQQMLAQKNVSLVYPLETPTTTPITDPTLLAQLETLINMKTYKEVTNIDLTGEDLAPVLDCDYYQDMSTLNDRLDELEARIELLEE